jgi:hypothetical protein
MNWPVIIIVTIALGTIISGILLLKQTATKFKLNEQQKARIKARNKMLEEQEKNED